MYKKIIISLLLIVGVFGSTSLTHALPVESVGVTPSQQTLSYATVPVYQNGVQTGTTKAYTGSILVSVTNPMEKSLCVTVPSTVSLGGYTFPVAGRSISGSGQWAGDNQICGTGNFQVTVSISVKSTTGAPLNAGTYTYPVTSNSVGYQNLSAALIIPQVSYYVTSYTVAPDNVATAKNFSHYFYRCDVSQDASAQGLGLPYLAGDYRMCSIVPVSSNEHTMWIEKSFRNSSGDYVVQGGSGTGVVASSLPQYDATVSSVQSIDAMKTDNAGGMANPSWTPVTLYKVSLNPVEGRIDCSVSNVQSGTCMTSFSGGSSVSVYSSSPVTPDTSNADVLTISPSSATLDSNTSLVEFKGVLTKKVYGGSSADINVTGLSATSWKSSNPAILAPITNPNGCYYTSSGVRKSDCTQEFKVISRPAVATPVSVTVESYGKAVSAMVTVLPAQKTITIQPERSSESFSGNSKGVSKTNRVTINTSGISNAINVVVTPPPQNIPLITYIATKYGTDNSGKIQRSGSDSSFAQDLILTRTNTDPTATTTGTITLTATDPVSGISTSTTITITIDGPVLPSPGSLQLLPQIQSMHVAEKDLPKTVFFDVTASTTADCNSISYVNGYLPDTTSSWVTPTRGFGGNKCLTRFAIDLPSNALNYLQQSNNSLTGVTAGTATINGTTTIGLAGFWVTVDPTSIVSPLTANLALSKSGAKVNEVITAGLTSAGGTGVKTYKINFGDGTGDKVGSSLSHAYAASGSYTVVGTVTDANGVTATDSKVININTVIVSGEGLSANLSVSPRTVDVGDSVNAVLSGSGGTGPYTTYKIDFGDGTISNTSSASNSYDAPGTYAVTGTVTDSASTTASKSVSVTVNYPRITAGIAITSPIPQSRIITPDKVIVSVSASGGRGAGTYRYSVDFGDGSSPMVYSNAGSGITNIQHTYAAISSVTNYQIQVTVTDVTGRAVSDSASVALTAYAPLVCTLNMNKSIGLPPFHPTFLVKTKGGTESKFEIRINADGSGTTDRTYVSNPATATTTLSNYVYLNSGSYSPIARVLDQDLIYNGFLMGTKNASTTCATSTTVLSGSGGETNPGL